MAEELPNPSEQLRIDRRKLLKTSVAITAVNFAPDLAPSETASVVSVQSVSTASEGILNICANTARRLLEIERRNELRRETKLPLLEVSKEWRRLKALDDARRCSEEFSQFEAIHREAVWAEVLQPRRKALGDQNWKPKYWSEGVGYQSEVYRILRERFRVDKKVIGSVR
jgi:hypothetical protein